MSNWAECNRAFPLGRQTLVGNVKGKKKVDIDLAGVLMLDEKFHKTFIL